MACNAKKARLLLHNQHAIKVSLFHHDTDGISPIEIDDIANACGASYSLLLMDTITDWLSAVNDKFGKYSCHSAICCFTLSSTPDTYPSTSLFSHP